MFTAHISVKKIHFLCEVNGREQQCNTVCSLVLITEVKKKEKQERGLTEEFFGTLYAHRYSSCLFSLHALNDSRVLMIKSAVFVEWLGCVSHWCAGYRRFQTLLTFGQKQTDIWRYRSSSWFQTFAVFWMLYEYAFFWAFPGVWIPTPGIAQKKIHSSRNSDHGDTEMWRV